MHVSFGMAQHTNGSCFLRFDDTNPEAEKQEYIDHIEEIVGWLSWKPYKVSFTKDQFCVRLESCCDIIKCHHAACMFAAMCFVHYNFDASKENGTISTSNPMTLCCKAR